MTELRDRYGLSWPKIAKIPKFKGIPIQTLSMVYHGKRAVPKKYRRQLGVPSMATVPVCPEHGEPHCYDCQTQTVQNRRRRSKKPANTYTRNRRKKLNEIAQSKGWKSWSSFETAMINGIVDFDDPYP